jgi:hypothetical protein
MKVNSTSTIVPRLKCRQEECVRNDAGNRVKFVQTIVVGDGRGPRHRVEADYSQIFLWSGASEETESFTKRLVTNETRSVRKLKWAVH